MDVPIKNGGSFHCFLYVHQAGYPMVIQWSSRLLGWQWDPNMKRILPASPQTWQLAATAMAAMGWSTTSIKKSTKTPHQVMACDGNMQVLPANKHWFQPQALSAWQRCLETRTGLCQTVSIATLRPTNFVKLRDKFHLQRLVNVLFWGFWTSLKQPYLLVIISPIISWVMFN